MNYADISKANSEINMIDLKGKNYAMVPERVNAFRKLFPEGFINTEIISHDGVNILMQARVGYYREDGTPVTLGTGFAQEAKGYGMVNKTSYIENCETSAVGRALGMIGLGINGGGICSAEELVNAITAQKQMKEEEEAECTKPLPEGGPVRSANKIPADPVSNYIMNEITDIQKLMKLQTYADAKKTVLELADALIASGAVKPFKWANVTREQAEAVFDAIRKTFKPEDAA